MKLPEEITTTKETLKEEYSENDFNNLFNEISGKKNITEDKYKDDLDEELKKHAIKDENDVADKGNNESKENDFEN